jgi:hypothetical protein
MGPGLALNAATRVSEMLNSVPAGPSKSYGPHRSRRSWDEVNLATGVTPRRVGLALQERADLGALEPTRPNRNLGWRYVIFGSRTMLTCSEPSL